MATVVQVGEYYSPLPYRTKAPQRVSALLRLYARFEASEYSILFSFVD